PLQQRNYPHEQPGQLPFYSPHTLDNEIIVGLCKATFNAVESDLSESSYESYILQTAFHAEIEGASPIQYTSKYASPLCDDVPSTIGSSVTYYFGQEESRTHSSVTLDMSGEYSECVFVRLALGYDGSEISHDELSQPVLDHIGQLLSYVGLNLDQ
ncbi:MAG: hypothetical protein OXP75_13090, partial [Rhodospirillales bacterium]|nr:hypothetical protein [Rhodospirillales bacterium]